jgi:hypothetical protein
LQKKEYVEGNQGKVRQPWKHKPWTTFENNIKQPFILLPKARQICNTKMLMFKVNELVCTFPKSKSGSVYFFQWRKLGQL